MRMLLTTSNVWLGQSNGRMLALDVMQYYTDPVCCTSKVMEATLFEMNSATTELGTLRVLLTLLPNPT